MGKIYKKIGGFIVCGFSGAGIPWLRIPSLYGLVVSALQDLPNLQKQSE